MPDLTPGILKSKAVHFRLQHFGLEKAGVLWDEIGEHDVWK